MKRIKISLVGFIVAFFIFLSLGLLNNEIKAQNGNLVTNPSFEIGGSAIGQEYNQNSWTFFVIEKLANGVVVSDAEDGSACFEIQTKGGCGFLHSEPFPVKSSSLSGYVPYGRGA